MKVTTHTGAWKSGAFTLIEMIGVLAVIAILAALLIPKIFEAINNARVNNAVVSYNTVKAAVMDHYGKYGKFEKYGTNTLTNPLNTYDTDVLLAEGLMDKVFQVKVGTSSRIQSRACAAGNTQPDLGTAAYWLSGSGSAANEATGQWVIEAVIFGVPEQDAIAISERLDGTTLSSTTGKDEKGRIKYAAPSAGVTDVYMYIAHR